MESDDGTRLIGSVDTSLQLLEVLQERDGAGVTELSTALGLNKGTVHTHLSTLRENEYVVKDGDAYRLSLRFLDLGNFVRDRIDYYDVVREEVDDLAGDCEELVQFATEEHGKAVYLYKSEGDQAVQTASRQGMRVDMHCVSLGKAMLSQFSRDRVEAIVDRHGLPQYTDNTIASRSELFDDLETARDRGYATDDREKIPGLRCVASPVVTGNAVLGAVSVTGPYSRIQGQRWKETLPDKVKRAANVIQINAQFSE